MNVQGLFSVLLEWTGPTLSMGFTLDSYLSHTELTYRIKEKLRSGEMLIPGDQWPIFLYAGYKYDAEDPWQGLCRSSLLVSVSCFGNTRSRHLSNSLWLSKAYKHVFTSPSSVDKTTKATRSGNARIHGMTRVTPASIAYIATQV